jgi:hypothetical protein
MIKAAARGIQLRPRRAARRPSVWREESDKIRSVAVPALSVTTTDSSRMNGVIR